MKETSGRFGAKSAADAVSADILELMRQGQIAPGQRLVEADIADRFEVSRTTVREALQRLEAKGFLAQERYRGFVVRSLSRRRLCEIYEVRASLDGMAARLAAPSVCKDSAEFETIVASLEAARAASDMTAFTECNARFHRLIRDRAGNATLLEILEQLDQSVYHMQFRLLVERTDVFVTQDDHNRLYAALRTGDTEAAASEAESHARHALDKLLSLPDTFFSKE